MYKFNKIKSINYTLGRINREGRGEVIPFRNMKFQQITKNNLDRLSRLFKITWATVHKFAIRQELRYSSYRHRTATSLYITGVDIQGNVFVYARKESTSPQAGQTWLYLDGSQPVQVSGVLTAETLPEKWENRFKF